MDSEHKKLISELVNLPHYHAFKKELDTRLLKLKDVMEIDLANPNFPWIAMGKKLAAEMITELISNLELQGETKEQKRSTYE